MGRVVTEQGTCCHIIFPALLGDLIKENCNVLNEILLKALNEPIKTSHESNIVPCETNYVYNNGFCKNVNLYSTF